VTVHFPDVMQYGTPGQAMSAPSGSASRLMAWVHRDALLKRLLAEIKDEEGSISSEERPQRVRQTEQHLLALEISEEKLVCHAIAAGLEVHRRPDCSPWVLLDLAVAEQAVPAEAAE